MPASADFDPYSLPLATRAVPVIVARMDSPGEYTVLPNVRCLEIPRQDGAHPSAARFEYDFDDSDPDGSPYPSGFEEVWPIDSGSVNTYAVGADDRIVVFGYTPQGTKRALFDGFAALPQGDVADGHQAATFSAAGVEVRLWDFPMAGAILRHSDHTDSTDQADNIPTDLACRFNPHAAGKSEPNKTPKDKDTSEELDGVTFNYPVFLDWRMERKPDPRTFWTLGDACKYLLWWGNDETYVKNPDFEALTARCKAKVPTADEGAGMFNPEDESTYDLEPITIRDFDATGKAMPDALATLLDYHGLAFRFEIGEEQDEDDVIRPTTTIKVYRKDGTDNQDRSICLQPDGSVLDPGLSNIGSLSLVRDHHQAANEFDVETGPVEYEVSIVLAPLFPIVAGDAESIDQFDLAKLATATNDVRRKYRWYGGDEDGSGHWDFALGATDTEALNLDDILGKPEEDVAQYVHRLRPGQHTLASLDDHDAPRVSSLAISRDYEGAAPAVWDGTGTWQDLGSHGWKLLKDRLGIEVTAHNPDAWPLGDNPTGTQNTGKIIHGIKSLAAPSPTYLNAKRFYLRLTTVIDGDYGLEAVAPKRAAVPTRFTIARRIDAKDHFKKQVVTANSLHAESDIDVEVRDDTDKAKAYAEAMRSVHEFPTLNGAIHIPALVNAYQIGDRVKRIDGLDVSLRINAGTAAGEGARYATIVAIDWQTGQSQGTTLHLSTRIAHVTALGTSLTKAHVGSVRSY